MKSKTITFDLFIFERKIRYSITIERALIFALTADTFWHNGNTNRKCSHVLAELCFNNVHVRVCECASVSMFI